ncbi:hypothetical protein [Prevotella conceptionensis]|nr:hypothetical protein [Prevotella conceptionensis]
MKVNIPKYPRNVREPADVKNLSQCDETADKDIFERHIKHEKHYFVLKSC